jgi:Macrocin-O-methyltransferase (TylF)/Methyltransferase domain
VPGDFLEAGVWRGGTCIFMRALLKLRGITDRTVWVADSFEGLPKPSLDADRNYDLSAISMLSVSQEDVQAAFQRFGLLDGQVKFLKGWFKDTLPNAPVERLAVLRMDGDLFESSTDILKALYHKVAPGGFVIVDDYYAAPPCKAAVDEFRARTGIAAPIRDIDGTGVFWRKPAESEERTAGVAKKPDDLIDGGPPGRTSRIDIVQRIIDQRKARTYLEIGVETGASFMPIRARRKIAVDPRLAIAFKSRIEWLFRNPDNLFAEYHETTSDEYFSRRPVKRLDVVFIDGLHTYAQALRDVDHALARLNENGVIVMHDCLPPHRAAAHPTQLTQSRAAELGIAGWTPEWCGDVWKAISHLRSQRDDLRVFVLNCDYGVGIVTRGEPESRLDLSTDELNRMTYDDLLRDGSNLLNLRSEHYLASFLSP